MLTTKRKRRHKIHLFIISQSCFFRWGTACSCPGRGQSLGNVSYGSPYCIPSPIHMGPSSMFPLRWGSLSGSWKSFCWNILYQSWKYIVTVLWFHTAWEVKAEEAGQERMGNSRTTFTVKDVGGHRPQLVHWQGELSVFEARILASLSSAIYGCRCSGLAYLPHSERNKQQPSSWEEV